MGPQNRRDQHVFHNKYSSARNNHLLGNDGLDAFCISLKTTGLKKQCTDDPTTPTSIKQLHTAILNLLCLLCLSFTVLGAVAPPFGCQSCYALPNGNF